MTILVTGSTGNIGRGVVARLAAAGQPVRAMTRTPAGARFPAGVETVHGDFEAPDTWGDVLHGVDRVHLFPYGYTAPGSGSGFLDRAVEAGVRRFVVHSAIAAAFDYQGDPDDPSLTALQRHLADEREAHRDIERAVEATGVEWTHVRPALLAVGALAWAEPIRATGTVREPFPESGSPLVHETDVAEVAVAALLTDDHVGAAYSLTGPAKVTQAEQVAAIGAAIGRDVRFEELTPEQARTEWLDPDQGLDQATIDWLLELLAASVGEPGIIAPTDTFEQVTGRPPRSFAQWAADHAEDFR
ncbi:uncharacterized protein YbjT (DUF2867 family) [Murinocardiopsis flavida]|uniref:Uncharacterized protein YbjT (DUF2867 family) n=1 Tax=Murinocardiopsis flavida TaxID=645275 RepID=A0A2P8DPF7_9ACTN|nr:NAD(P)H-binding protein [Murinocardiopsis flavida]PSK99090.1 uncharacterized protein YbjT (DUF2867 family) [Murinocardiopsis flavida]